MNDTTGLVVANDEDLKRTHTLVHQLKRLGAPCWAATHGDAQAYQKPAGFRVLRGDAAAYEPSSTLAMPEKNRNGGPLSLAGNMTSEGSVGSCSLRNVGGLSSVTSIRATTSESMPSSRKRRPRSTASSKSHAAQHHHSAPHS